MKLLPKQDEAVFSKASNIAFGGAWGSGKTIALAIWIKLKSEISNNLILVGRKTYDELRDTTQREFFDLFPELTQFHNKNENATYLPNKTTILWRHLDEWHKLSNLNLGNFCIDQAEEISEECFLALQGRLRRQIDGRQSFIVFNTEGHNWIWKLFKNESREGYHLIETTSFDNPYLPEDYFQRLKNLPQNVIKRYVFGSWAVFEGQVWEDFNEPTHVIQPFNIPDGWDRMVGLDHGVTNPTAVLWAAINYDGTVFCVSPDTKLLSSDLVWVNAGEIEVGDNLLGFDENVPSETKKRRWKEGIVESARTVTQPSYKLTLSDGTTLKCSSKHKWLVQTLGSRQKWVATDKIKIGWKLSKVLDVWETDKSFEAGYLSSAFEGEGCLCFDKNKRLSLSFTQKNNCFLYKTIFFLEKLGLRLGKYKRGFNDVSGVQITRKRDILKFLGSIRPQRLLDKFKVSMIGGIVAFDKPSVVKKEFLGNIDVVSIQTSSRTFIADGFASHNCYDEHYKSGETVSYHSSEIKKRDNSNVRSWLIDPSCNAKVNVKNGQFYSIVDEYRDEGLYFYPANNDVLSGINRVAEYFKSKRLFIFKNCVNLINEINQYKWQRLKPGEEKNQPDKPVKHMDHAVDVLRYLIASRAFATEKSETPRVGYFSPAYWSDRQETYEEKFV